MVFHLNEILLLKCYEPYDLTIKKENYNLPV